MRYDAACYLHQLMMKVLDEQFVVVRMNNKETPLFSDHLEGFLY